jgi:hypothetical protein
MSWNDRAALIVMGASVIIPWFLTSLTEGLGWGVRRDHHR